MKSAFAAQIVFQHSIHDLSRPVSLRVATDRHFELYLAVFHEMRPESWNEFWIPIRDYRIGESIQLENIVEEASATSVALSVTWAVKKWTLFENLSTKVIIQSNPEEVRGRWVTKSIDTEPQRREESSSSCGAPMVSVVCPCSFDIHSILDSSTVFKDILALISPVMQLRSRKSLWISKVARGMVVMGQKQYVLDILSWNAGKYVTIEIVFL